MASNSSPDSNQWGLLLCGLLALVASAYFDGMKGPLLPVIVKELSLPYGQASWFLTVANIGALFASLFLNRIMARFGERATFLGVLGFAAVTSLVSLSVVTLGTLLVFGAMLGGLVSLLGTMCSILILQGGAVRYRGNIFSGSQVLVGLSFLIFPLLLEGALARGIPWNNLVAPAALCFFAVAVLASRMMPRPEPLNAAPLEKPPVTRVHVLVIVLFGVYVAGEAMCFAWLVTFARDALGKNDAEATAMLVRFFMWFSGSRFVASLGLRAHVEARAIYLCLGLGAAAAIVGLFGYPAAFPMVGLVGPFFPLMLTHASRIFPTEWKRITVWVFLYIQLFMAATHLLVGYLAQRFGLGATYWLLPFFFVVAFMIFAVFRQRVRAGRANA